MELKITKSKLGIVCALGAIWGLSEAALGMGLRACAASMSGSMMTGVALLFLAAGWAVSRSALGILLMVTIASVFKMVDAFLLSLPFLHGAVANPIFAFFMEGIAFILIISLVRDSLLERKIGQGAAGGMAALLAVNLFPLVKYATGIPACTAAGTGIPLSLYYAYIAVAASVITVPFGLWIGAKILSLDTPSVTTSGGRLWKRAASPAAVIVSFVALLILRLI